MTPQYPPAPQVFLGALNVVQGLMRDSAQVAGPLRSLVMLTGYAAQHWDNCVADRLEEIAGLRPLLAKGAEIAPNLLKAKLEAALATSAGPLDCRVSALEIVLEHLRGALIDLQIWLEEPESTQHSALLNETWAFLRASTDASRGLMRHMW